MNRLFLSILFLILQWQMPLGAQEKIKIWDGVKNCAKKQQWSELTVFKAAKPDSSGVSVIICPGGSYVYLDMDNEGYAVAKYLNTQGITAFVLKYRTAWQNNHHPAMIQDLQRAIQIVKNNAENFGINPEQVGVMGFSAGGHLSGTAAIFFRENWLKPFDIEPQEQDFFKPRFAAMIYPVVSMQDSLAHQRSRKNLLGKHYTKVDMDKFSLDLQIVENMPPIFLVTTADDPVVMPRNSYALANALTAKNIFHQTLFFKTGGHGFGINEKKGGEAAEWRWNFLDFLKQIKVLK